MGFNCKMTIANLMRSFGGHVGLTMNRVSSVVPVCLLKVCCRVLAGLLKSCGRMTISESMCLFRYGNGVENRASWCQHVHPCVKRLVINNSLQRFIHKFLWKTKMGFEDRKQSLLGKNYFLREAKSVSRDTKHSLGG